VIVDIILITGYGLQAAKDVDTDARGCCQQSVGGSSRGAATFR